ncbi:MAG: response regulator [Atopobiaceae bacterium]|jgi:CheY-like chemotaxis protein|nr:response regulator [Atopobiaceae bacterium]
MIQIDVAVCDDEPFVAKTISEVAQKELSRHGFQARIEIVNDALSLARELKEQGFDLMLLDIEMPLVDGIEFSRMLREKGDRTELVFVSNAEDRVFESLPVRPALLCPEEPFR